MTKEENELYGGSFFKLGKDHHQDLYEHNLKYNEELSIITQELLLQEEEEMYEYIDKLKFIEELNNIKELTCGTFILSINM